MRKIQAINFGRLKTALKIFMNRTQLHTQIDSLLEKLSTNNTFLKGYEGKFSQLETDLLRKQCIELYDAINQLHLTNMMDKSKKTVEGETKNEQEKSEAEPHIVDIKESELPPEVLQSKPVSDLEKEETEPKSKPVFDIPKFVPIVEKPAAVIEPPKKIVEEKSVLDKMNETKKSTTLHDSISIKKEEQELAHRFANSSITKIKDAIDISKHFEIQSNLFRSDSAFYNQAINDLENAESKLSALDIFDELSARYHWGQENELAQELKSFIYRKF